MYKTTKTYFYCNKNHIFRILYLSLFTIMLLRTGGIVASERLTFSSYERQVTLIELFTSQGCNSCPPAEKWLSQFKDDPRLWKDLVPVAFHVDYWDYLGWRDTLANPVYSKRQHRYQKDGNISTVYTPGFVVNGSEWRSWFGLRELPTSHKIAGELKVSVEGKRLSARYIPSSEFDGPLQLNLAIVGTGIAQPIESGENAGRTLTQDFSVLRYIRLRSDSGQWQTTLPHIDHPAARLALAAWVNKQGNQRPLQATGGWLSH